MAIAKVIGKITMTSQQYESLINLGVTDIAIDNPVNRYDADEIINRIGDAEAIIINISIQITREIIKRCARLKFIQTWSTGMDNIEISAAEEAGILIKNVPDFSTESVAEKTLSMMIFIANKMQEANLDVIAGHWNYTNFQGIELKNKTLGIIGTGRIGSRVAELAQAFGMNVLIANSKTGKEGIYNVCNQSDFITIHCPLKPETYKLMSEKEFSLMKKGIYLINNSRGGVVDEIALLKALENETIAYASIDVFEQEPPDKNHPLIHHPRVFVTPHIAWNTAESVQRLTDHCIDNLKKYLLNIPIAIDNAKSGAMI